MPGFGPDENEGGNPAGCGNCEFQRARPSNRATEQPSNRLRSGDRLSPVSVRRCPRFDAGPKGKAPAYMLNPGERASVRPTSCHQAPAHAGKAALMPSAIMTALDPIVKCGHVVREGGTMSLILSAAARLERDHGGYARRVRISPSHAPRAAGNARQYPRDRRR
jgi:hypothetical protein